jgi:hypothetical protein
MIAAAPTWLPNSATVAQMTNVTVPKLARDDRPEPPAKAVDIGHLRRTA